MKMFNKKQLNFKHSLTANMLLIPSGIILLSFIIIFAAFHVVVQQYIDSITSKIIKDEFEYVESDYSVNSNTSLYLENQNDNFIATVNKMILDEKCNLLLPDDSFFISENEKIKSNSIAKYYANGNEIPISKSPFKQTIGKHTYMMQGKIYQGTFDGYFLDFSKKGPNTSEYTILVYTDITYIQDFIKKMDTVLISLLLFFGFITIMSILHMLKKVTFSFKFLNEFLRKIGKREKNIETPSFTFVEFDDVVKNALLMSEMIDASENNQKKFFQNASHELRTPLMSIQGYAEGLKYDVIKDSANAYDVILKESKKMSNLVDEILFLSKFEATVPKTDNIKLEEILYSSIDNIYTHSEKENPDIKIDISTNLSTIGDESLLQKVFENILSNAMRYANSLITISSKIEDSNVVTHIIDDGDGIAPEDFPHIFERFYKGKNGNFGIGLSMANDIVKQHGGNIVVKSEKGNTEFTVILPC